MHTHTQKKLIKNYTILHVTMFLLVRNIISVQNFTSKYSFLDREMGLKYKNLGFTILYSTPL